MMTIELLCHLSGYKCLEYYYCNEVQKGALHSYFPAAPSHDSFVQLKLRIVTLMILHLHYCRLGALCGVYYADSTSIVVCNNRRIHSHRVFRGKAARGRSSTGWFFGFKRFLVVNAFGQTVRVAFTPGNAADNNTRRLIKLFDKLQGWVFADKGFVNQKAFGQLFKKGLRPITGIRSNMKNKLMDMTQKMLLKKRGMIESVNDILKTVCDIGHTRHRSPINAVLNIFSGISAYTFPDRLTSVFI